VSTDAVPGAAYLDTSVVVAAIIDGHVHQPRSVAFCARLIAAGSDVNTSEILRLELSQALAQLPHDPGLSTDLRRAYRLRRWATSVEVRQRWLTAGVRRVSGLMSQFAHVTEVPFDRTIWEVSLGIMAQLQLRSHDAIHVATARGIGVRDFATLDGHFRRVPDLRLWLV
jgi:predicted nucleic acid-binding protein